MTRLPCVTHVIQNVPVCILLHRIAPTHDGVTQMTVFLDSSITPGIHLLEIFGSVDYCKDPSLGDRRE
jgi:hypothetical protein